MTVNITNKPKYLSENSKATNEQLDKSIDHKRNAKATAPTTQSNIFVLGNMSRNRPPGGIGLVRPLGCPPHNSRSTLRGELLVEHAAIPIRLLAVRNISTPLRLRVLKLLVRNHLLGGILYSC